MFTNPIKCQSRRNLALVLKSQVKEKKGKEKIYYGHLHNLHSFITFSNLSPVLFFSFFFLTRKMQREKTYIFLSFGEKRNEEDWKNSQTGDPQGLDMT